MLELKNLNLKKKKFKNIFIVEDRNYWPNCSNICNKQNDLVLCIDFALKKQLTEKGYYVEFLDHLIDSETLERFNIETHNFLNNWYKDKEGNDYFDYKGYSIGDSLLLYIINDVVYFCHYFFNLLSLKAIEYDKLYAVSNDYTILDCLNKIGLDYIHLKESNNSKLKSVYLFPIIKWVNEKVNPTFRHRLKNSVANFFDFYFKFYDLISNDDKSVVFIQNYYPTNPIIEEIKKNKTIQVFLPNYVGLRKIYKFRRVHYKSNLVSKNISNEMILNFRAKQNLKWDVFLYPISDYLYEIIDSVLNVHLLEALNKAESIELWMRSVNLKLMIPITNLWTPNRLMMQYCFKNKIPVYTVINGQLNVSYYNDAKDSDYVNSYSFSIKKNYFQEVNNVFPLGDPRMDFYAKFSHKVINRDSPTIVIGTAGYDSIDLNSYLAYEFDFLYDILFCINELINKGYKANLIIKVRGNGYLDLYTNFVNEYFSCLKIVLIQDKSFFEVIKEADLYLSIFSQTIFEASCLGIPVIYYKKDTQFIHEPFDGKSELVTACNIDELQEKFNQFYNGDDSFNAFMEKTVLEKYIGPLDGNNTQRNIDFIMDLISSKHKN